MTKMTRAQLCLMRSLLKAGSPLELIDIFLTRCGATQAEWQALLEAGHVSKETGRWQLTVSGRRTYNKQKVGRYF